MPSSFPSKEKREKCWATRDMFWECLEKYAPRHSSTSGEEVPQACLKLRKDFESSCPGQWVKHFDRKRTFAQFKKKMDGGYDPVPKTEGEENPPPS